MAVLAGSEAPGAIGRAKPSPPSENTIATGDSGWFTSTEILRWPERLARNGSCSRYLEWRAKYRVPQMVPPTIKRRDSVAEVHRPKRNLPERPNGPGHNILRITNRRSES
jgi:hypothetical protein